MSKGLKICLWVVLVMDIITFLFYGRIFFLADASAAAAGMLLELIQIAGVSILLFNRRKTGFYIICLSEVVIFAVNVTLFGSDIIMSLINSAVVPLAVYAFMKPFWNTWR